MNWFKQIFSGNHSPPERPAPVTKVENREPRRQVTIAADNPITSESDDALNRTAMAHSFADQIQAIDAGNGLVVGVLGPWGSGKTSFVNLARRNLEYDGIAVLDFNPWMFSGADQLVQAFFVEVTAQLKLRPGFAEIGGLIEEYGEAFSGLGWLPFVGPWIERGHKATGILAKLLQSKKEGAGGRRAKVTRALTDIPAPIVVVLDDIDRLTTPEIRDVFKLVRLTANFPNIVYLLAFDRVRVEQALGEQGIPGRDYLEKILQIGVDLPAVPFDVLNSQIFTGIDGALVGIEKPGDFDSNVWPDVFMEIIRPLIRNMRDVRRFAAAIHGAVRDLGGQVALVDALALEAIRVFLPDVFARLHSSVAGLTTTSSDLGRGREPEHLKEQIDVLIESAGNHQQVVRSLIERLFPAAQRHIGGSHYGGDWKNGWLVNRRIAHEDILRLYLERVVGERLQAFSSAEIAWSKLADKGAFSEFLGDLPTEQLREVISMLEAYEEKYTLEHVVPGSVVLLNLQPTIPDVQRGMFDFGARMTVTRVVYRLVRSLDGPAAVEAAVREILPQVSLLSPKLDLITIVGHRDGAGHRLVTEEAAKGLEQEWRAEVRGADPALLSQEVDLIRVLGLAIDDAKEDEPTISVPDLPEITLALLESAKSEVKSQAMGSRAVVRKPRLHWEGLVKIYGDEGTLRQRIDALKAATTEVDRDLVELVDKYLSGWRPKEFDDD